MSHPPAAGCAADKERHAREQDAQAASQPKYKKFLESVAEFKARAVAALKRRRVSRSKAPAGKKLQRAKEDALDEKRAAKRTAKRAAKRVRIARRDEFVLTVMLLGSSRDEF